MNTTLNAQPLSLSGSKTWNVLLWTAQIGLAGLFLMGGWMKLTAPIAMTPMAGSGLPDLLIRFIGLSEVAGAIGLLLPAALRIKPQLTVLAALGFALIMVLAIGFHLARGEGAGIGMNILFGGVALFIAWGRSRKAEILGREKGKGREGKVRGGEGV